MDVAAVYGQFRVYLRPPMASVEWLKLVDPTAIFRAMVRHDLDIEPTMLPVAYDEEGGLYSGQVLRRSQFVQFPIIFPLLFIIFHEVYHAFSRFLSAFGVEAATRGCS